MPRIYTVKAARKPAVCNKCGKAIEVGQGYIWWQFYHSKETKRCLKCPHPRQSELTQSDKKSRLYAAQESIEDAISNQPTDFDSIEDFDVSGLAEALRSAAEEIRGVGEEYNESADNIEQYISSSQTIDECREWAEGCEAWADALETAADEIESVEPDVPDEPEELEIEQEEDKTGTPIMEYLVAMEDWRMACTAAFADAAEAAINTAQEALDSDQPSCM